MKWTNSYRSFGLKTKRSTGLKTIEHKQPSAVRSNATRGSRPTRANPTVPIGPGGSRPGLGRAAITSPGRPGARPPGGAPKRASRIACRMTGCGRGWRRSWAAAGRRRPSAAGCASCSPATMPCACARRPSTDGSIPASRAANAGPDACRAATGGGASMRAVGCRGSLSPEGSVYVQWF